MEILVAVIVSLFLAFPPSAPETRTCLVEVDGKCVQYDFTSSRGENPLGNKLELIEAEREVQ